MTSSFTIPPSSRSFKPYKGLSSNPLCYNTAIKIKGVSNPIRDYLQIPFELALFKAISLFQTL